MPGRLSWRRVLGLWVVVGLPWVARRALAQVTWVVAARGVEVRPWQVVLPVEDPRQHLNRLEDHREGGRCCVHCWGGCREADQAYPETAPGRCAHSRGAGQWEAPGPYSEWVDCQEGGPAWRSLRSQVVARPCASHLEGRQEEQRCHGRCLEAGHLTEAAHSVGEGLPTGAAQPCGRYREDRRQEEERYHGRYREDRRQEEERYHGRYREDRRQEEERCHGRYREGRRQGHGGWLRHQEDHGRAGPRCQSVPPTEQRRCCARWWVEVAHVPAEAGGAVVAPGRRLVVPTHQVLPWAG
jgi:hypothetical protein